MVNAQFWLTVAVSAALFVAIFTPLILVTHYAREARYWRRLAELRGRQIRSSEPTAFTVWRSTGDPWLYDERKEKADCGS